jgi:hypothetical protein
MKLSLGRGLKSINHYSNELLRSDDMNFISESMYTMITEILGILGNRFNQNTSGYDDKDYVVGGLLAYAAGGNLTMTLLAGACVSFSGNYVSNGVWGFNVAPGEMFSVVVPDTTLIGVDTNASGTYDRYDVVEIRPVKQNFNSVSRQFKDPVTGIITSSLVNTKSEYTFEFQVLKGDASQLNYVRSKTAGWIKIAEVRVLAGAATISGSDVRPASSSDTWLGDTAKTVRPKINDYNLNLGISGFGTINAVDIPVVNTGAWSVQSNIEDALRDEVQTASIRNSHLVSRDAAGRAQVNDPSAAQDIMTKNYMDVNSDSQPTVSKWVKRDANGRAQIVAPSVDLDITNKLYADSKIKIINARLCHTAITQTMNALQFGSTTPSGEMFYLPAYSRLVFIYSTGVYTSDDDGVSWTSRTRAGTYDAMGKSIQLPSKRIVIAMGNTTNGFYYSDDGITWTASGPAFKFRGMVFAGGSINLIVALVYASGTAYYTSPDGVTWTSRSNLPVSVQWADVDWSPEQGLLVANSITSAATNCATSTDGVNWSSMSPGVTMVWTGVKWWSKLSMWIMTENSGAQKFYKSTTGQSSSWSIFANCPPNLLFSSIRSVIYDPEAEIFIGASSPGSPSTVFWFTTDFKTYGSFNPSAYTSFLGGIPSYIAELQVVFYPAITNASGSVMNVSASSKITF